MKHASIVNVALFSVVLAGGMLEAACTEPAATRRTTGGRDTTDEEDATPKPGTPGSGTTDGGMARPAEKASATEIPKCTKYVDAAESGSGTAASPFGSIGEAVAGAADGDIICVAEGDYAEKIKSGQKGFTLAGGFQSGSQFKVRDSAKYPSKANGGGSGNFVLIEGTALVAIDGFDITGYDQAIVRQLNSVGKVEITNNSIHDIECPTGDRVALGGGFSLANVKAVVKGNVFRNNKCGRGGAGAVTDSSKQTDFTLDHNLIEGNSGVEPESSHGGAIYVFGNKVTVTNNVFTNNSVTGWGGGLYLGSDQTVGQKTTATITWNVYRGNKAGTNGGGMFCDDGATCRSDHEIYDGNCGGNVYVDSAYSGGPATMATFDHMTNVNALEAGCGGPGAGWRSDRDNSGAPDTYEIKNSIFFGNGDGLDIAAGCSSNCGSLTVTHSLVQTEYQQGGLDVSFGTGNLRPTDPLFVDAAEGDFHLKSKGGHWTPTGFVKDSVNSPALGKGDDGSELGAFGGSAEASK